MAENPWDVDTWNETEQAVYLRTYGKARADARSADAGTTVGGKRLNKPPINRIGAPGPRGPPGDAGWSPIFSVVTDVTRKVLQVSNWTGGIGTKPPIGKYIGTTGFVPLIADGVNISGGALSIRNIAAASVYSSDLALNTAEVLRINTGELGFYANDNNVLKYMLFISSGGTVSVQFFSADFFKAKMNYGLGAR